MKVAISGYTRSWVHIWDIKMDATGYPLPFGHQMLEVYR